MYYIGSWNVPLNDGSAAQAFTSLDTEHGITMQHVPDRGLWRWAPPSKNGEPQPYSPWLHYDQVTAIAI